MNHSHIKFLLLKNFNFILNIIKFILYVAFYLLKYIYLLMYIK